MSHVLNCHVHILDKILIWIDGLSNFMFIGYTFEILKRPFDFSFSLDN